jgi:PAS domain S-box-containing protein
MPRNTTRPTGVESPFGIDEIIVTKTDMQGTIKYANDVFLRVSRVSLKEALGKPHNIIRHPEMPRCVFKLLWETLSAGGEFFGYVQNLAANGDHYWVFAHATPSRDSNGRVIGYHSSRRRPDPAQVARVKPVYQRLLQAEAGAADRKLSMEQGNASLQAFLTEQGTSYERFVFSV